jgi:hypothetical protein
MDNVTLYPLVQRRRISGFSVSVAVVSGSLAATGRAIQALYSPCLRVAQGLLIHIIEASYQQMFALALGETAKAYLYAISTLFTSSTGGWQRVVRYAAQFRRSCLLWRDSL